MDLLLAICQAIGLALAVGVGGPLAALFIAVMASFQAGIDPRGTDWEFLGETWFLGVLLAANVVGFYLARSRRESARRAFQAGLAGAFGAVAGAASLAERGEPAAVGLVIGLLVGAGSALLAADILAGARNRASRGRRGSEPDEAATAATLELIFAFAGIVIALLALFPAPLSLLGLVGLAVLAAGRRRRAGEKYEGLRVLR